VAGVVGPAAPTVHPPVPTGAGAASGRPVGGGAVGWASVRPGSPLRPGQVGLAGLVALALALALASVLEVVVEADRGRLQRGPRVVGGPSQRGGTWP
jgi:hypothetical protein